MRWIQALVLGFLCTTACASTTSSTWPVHVKLRDASQPGGRSLQIYDTPQYGMAAGSGAGHYVIVFDSSDGPAVNGHKALDHTYYMVTAATHENSTTHIADQWDFSCFYYSGDTVSTTGGPFVFTGTLSDPGWVYYGFQLGYNSSTGVWTKSATGKTRPDLTWSEALPQLKLKGAGPGGADLTGSDCLTDFETSQFNYMCNFTAGVTGAQAARLKWHTIATAICSTFTTDPNASTAITHYWSIDDGAAIPASGLSVKNLGETITTTSPYTNRTYIGAFEFFELWDFISSHSVNPLTFVPVPLPPLEGFPDSDGSVWWKDPQIRAVPNWILDTTYNWQRLQALTPTDPTPPSWYPKTDTGTGTGTGTGTDTATGTGTEVGTGTGTGTGSATGTATSTGTGTGTGSVTGTGTGTNTATGTGTGTSSSTATSTSTGTGTTTGTGTGTSTGTGTGTGSGTSSGTGTGTGTGSGTGTGTGTGTGNFTSTGTGTGTGTFTYTGPPASDFPDSPLPPGSGSASPNSGVMPGDPMATFSHLVSSWDGWSPTSQTAATIQISVPLPGHPNAPFTYTLSSLPDTSTSWGASLNVLRLLFRTFLTALLLYKFFQRCYAVLVKVS